MKHFPLLLTAAILMAAIACDKVKDPITPTNSKQNREAL